MINKRMIGLQGEKQGVLFLQKNGYKILDSNFYTRYGEIDLVAKENNDTVFIEIKLRRSKEYGMPSESVNTNKQQKIVKAALQYIKKFNLFTENIRFDVLAIGPGYEEIEIIKSAFTVPPKYTF